MAKKILTGRKINGKIYWSKKIKGKIYYFGTNYREAVAEYREKLPFLEAGVPIPENDGATVGDLFNHFLTRCQKKMDQGKLSKRTYHDYEEATEDIVKVIPPKTRLSVLTPKHFEKLRDHLAKTKDGKGEVSVRKHNQKLGYARTLFNFASIDNKFTDRLIPCKTALANNELSEMRKYKSTLPPRRLSADEIRRCIAAANPRIKATILLGINGGYNNSDIKQLEFSDIEGFETSNLISYPRRKTYFLRQTPIWPETKSAILEAIAARPLVSHPFVFVRPGGENYDHTIQYCHLSNAFYRILKATKIWSPGKNFGALRTTFSNVAKELSDDLAVKALMGHNDGSTLYSHYADSVYLPRLKAVTDHVRKWLYPDH